MHRHSVKTFGFLGSARAEAIADDLVWRGSCCAGSGPSARSGQRRCHSAGSQGKRLHRAVS